MRRTPPATAARRQRGLSLFGLLLWAIVIGFIGYMLVQAVPTVNEYLTIQRAVEKVAQSNPGSVAEARAAFEKQKDIEYAITSIGGNDLEITKENDKVVVKFAYDKLLPVFGPVYMLIKYEGRSK